MGGNKISPLTICPPFQSCKLPPPNVLGWRICRTQRDGLLAGPPNAGVRTDGYLLVTKTSFWLWMHFTSASWEHLQWRTWGRGLHMSAGYYRLVSTTDGGREVAASFELSTWPECQRSLPLRRQVSFSPFTRHHLQAKLFYSWKELSPSCKVIWACYDDDVAGYLGDARTT